MQNQIHSISGSVVAKRALRHISRHILCRQPLTLCAGVVLILLTLLNGLFSFDALLQRTPFVV